MGRDRIRRDHRQPCDTTGVGVGAEDAHGARSRSGSRTTMIAGDGQSPSPGRTATAVQSLSPGYFPFVMATSIISTGTFLLGPSWLSRVMLVIASAVLGVLGVALVIQLALFRPGAAASFHDPERVFGFFAIAAGIDVLGIRLAAAGHPLTTAILAGMAAAVWLVLTYGVPASLLLRRSHDSVLGDVNGTWLLCRLGWVSTWCLWLQRGCCDTVDSDTMQVGHSRL